MSLPAVVWWDFDGTLVNTETVWEEVERALARDLGGELAADYTEATIGGTVAVTADYIVAVTGTSQSPSSVAAELERRALIALSAQPVAWMPGARDLVAELADAGVRQGIVSSSDRHVIDLVLRGLGEVPFEVIVSRDDVTRTKPHPEPYLRACATAGVRPQDCLVIEDSAAGAAAGNAAGCTVIAVPSQASLSPQPGRVILPSLAGVDLAAMLALAASA